MEAESYLSPLTTSSMSSPIQVPSQLAEPGFQAILEGLKGGCRSHPRGMIFQRARATLPKKIRSSLSQAYFILLAAVLDFFLDVPTAFLDLAYSPYWESLIELCICLAL